MQGTFSFRTFVLAKPLGHVASAKSYRTHISWDFDSRKCLGAEKTWCMPEDTHYVSMKNNLTNLSSHADNETKVFRRRATF